MTVALALFSALLHVYIFVMESILWGTPRVNKSFGVKTEDALVMKPFAFNQGFYNLFLSIAIIVGLFLIHSQGKQQGIYLVDYAMLSIFGAGIVLFSSNSSLWFPATMQALPPFIYCIFRIIQLSRGVA